MREYDLFSAPWLEFREDRSIAEMAEKLVAFREKSAAGKEVYVMTIDAPSKRDRYMLFIMLLPLLCGVTIDLVMSYTRTWSAAMVDLEVLLKEVSWFAIGLTLAICPDIPLRAMSGRLLAAVQRRHGFVSFLRILGLLLVLAILLSFPFLVARLFKGVQL